MASLAMKATEGDDYCGESGDGDGLSLKGHHSEAQQTTSNGASSQGEGWRDGGTERLIGSSASCDLPRLIQI